MTVDGITHVTLPVSELAESVEFYETVLEASPVGPPGETTSVESADRYWFQVATGQYIVLTDSTGPEAGREPGGHGPTVSFRTDESDLVGLRARLDALGHDYRESTTTLSFSDPDGNTLAVTTVVGPAE